MGVVLIVCHLVSHLSAAISCRGCHHSWWQR